MRIHKRKHIMDDDFTLTFIYNGIINPTYLENKLARHLYSIGMPFDEIHVVPHLVNSNQIAVFSEIIIFFKEEINVFIFKLKYTEKDINTLIDELLG